MDWYTIKYNMGWYAIKHNQILDSADYISLAANSLANGMNQSVLPPG